MILHTGIIHGESSYTMFDGIVNDKFDIFIRLGDLSGKSNGTFIGLIPVGTLLEMRKNIQNIQNQLTNSMK